MWDLNLHRNLHKRTCQQSGWLDWPAGSAFLSHVRHWWPLRVTTTQQKCHTAPGNGRVLRLYTHTQKKNPLILLNTQLKHNKATLCDILGFEGLAMHCCKLLHLNIFDSISDAWRVVLIWRDVCHSELHNGASGELGTVSIVFISVNKQNDFEAMYFLVKQCYFKGKINSLSGTPGSCIISYHLKLQSVI